MKSFTVKTGLKLPLMGLGCMGLTAFYGDPIPEADAIAFLAKAHAGGITFFDTAEAYKQGSWGEHTDTDPHNESTLGKFFKTVPRDSFTIATKFSPGLFGHTDCKLATVEGAVDLSLKRLGLEYIDLYYCHRMPDTLPELEDWMNAAKALVAKGKIKYVGLSEPAPSWLEKAHSIHPITAVQQEWNLATRNIEELLLPTCKKLGVALVAYSPLARNLLTAKKDSTAPADWRSTIPRYQGENFEKNKAVAECIAEIAGKKGCTNAQVCLAWLYKRASQLGVDLSLIPGTTKIENALANVEGTKVDLTDEEFENLSELGKQFVGARGDEDYLASTIEGQIQKQ